MPLNRLRNLEILLADKELPLSSEQTLQLCQYLLLLITSTVSHGLQNWIYLALEGTEIKKIKVKKLHIIQKNNCLLDSEHDFHLEYQSICDSDQQVLLSKGKGRGESFSTSDLSLTIQEMTQLRNIAQEGVWGE